MSRCLAINIFSGCTFWNYWNVVFVQLFMYSTTARFGVAAVFSLVEFIEIPRAARITSNVVSPEFLPPIANIIGFHLGFFAPATLLSLGQCLTVGLTLTSALVGLAFIGHCLTVGLACTSLPCPLADGCIFVSHIILDCVLLIHGLS